MAGVLRTRTDFSTTQKVLWVAGASSAAVVGAAVSGSLATATYFARKVLTPDQRRPDDTEILAVDADRITLAVSPETVVPGRYGLWLDGGAGHARVSDILERDGHADRWCAGSSPWTRARWPRGPLAGTRTITGRPAHEHRPALPRRGRRG